MKKTSNQSVLLVAVLLCFGALSYVGAKSLLWPQPEGAGVVAEVSPRENPSIHHSSPDSVGNYRIARADPRYDQELRSVPLAPQFDLLLERAKKDPGFAYSLAAVLRDCSNLSLEEAAYLEKADSSAEYGREFEVEQHALLAEKQKRCEGVSNSAELRHDLIDRAASSGVVEAQIAFRAIAADFIASEGAMKRKNAMEQYKAKTLKYAYEAARSGSPEALFNAYDVASSGLFAPRNDVLAYSYLYAYSDVRPSPRTSRLLATESKRLSASELASAQDAAKKIFARSISQGARE